MLVAGTSVCIWRFDAFDLVLNAGVVLSLCTNLIEPLVYIKLTRTMLSLPRPFKSPFGVWGAGLSFGLTVGIMVLVIAYIERYRLLFMGAAGAAILFLVLYLVFLRKSVQNVGLEKLFIKNSLQQRFKEKVSSNRDSLSQLHKKKVNKKELLETSTMFDSDTDSFRSPVATRSSSLLSS
jgi:amino acid transporter